ncbi:MAG: TonB-dependent receptor, partial [Betaproteobacteria bacterium]|nr:TonB-dependent receptor [Betaproteobacteria bacterium]
FQTATPAPLSNTSVAYNPDTGGVRIINGTLPVGNSSNPFTTATPINYAFYDVGPRNTDINSKSYRVLGGLKGNVGTWDWETGVGHAENKVGQINYNRVDAIQLLAAIANNTYNFLNPLNGSIKADNLRINPRRDSLSKLDFVDFKISSEIATLPAGPLGFAAGLEFRKESIVDRPDVLLTTGRVLGQGSTATDGSRDNTAGFFEFSVPVLKNLEMQIAGRQDKYSDFGSAFSPKFGLKWNPSRELIVRGTVSRGFRAPTLPENARSSATFFTSVVDTLPTSPNANRTVNIAGVFAGNQNLKPERSRNYNLGIVWEPSNDLNIGLGFFKIEQNNVVSSNGFQTVVNNPAQYPGQILRAADGTLVAVFDQFRNLALNETSGIDLDFRKTFTTRNWGKFTVNGDWVFVSTFKSQPAEGQDIVDYIDSNGFQGGGQPRFRGRLGLTWDMGAFSTTLNRLYNHSWDQQQVAVPPAQDRIGSYQQYDLFLAYNGFKNLKLFASIQNLLDAKPPFDPQNGGTATTVQYDISQNDLRGRYYTIGMKYSF